MKTGKIPCVILVRDGSLIPTVPVAQSTDKIDWSKMSLVPYHSAENVRCTGAVFKPGDTKVQIVSK